MQDAQFLPIAEWKLYNWSQDITLILLQAKHHSQKSSAMDMMTAQVQIKLEFIIIKYEQWPT